MTLFGGDYPLLMESCLLTNAPSFIDFGLLFNLYIVSQLVRMSSLLSKF